MTVAAVAAIAPLRAEPSVRSEQVTQLLLGETADVLETEASWRRVLTHDVGYEAWVHAGYVRELNAAEAAAWRGRAVWRSEEAMLERHSEGAPVERLEDAPVERLEGAPV